MLFSSIYGLTGVKDRLINSVKTNHVAHAQMFVGREGSANMAMALAFATYINCENKQEEDACGECGSCQKMERFVHPDIHFVFPNISVPQADKEKHRAASSKLWRTFLGSHAYGNLPDWTDALQAENKQAIISVDEAREIVKAVTLKAFEGEYKIVFVWLPEQMNTAAANSILKILEEPPKKTLFLLVSNDADRNLTTIISRCQSVKIPSFTDADILGSLTNRFEIEEELAKNVTQLADGNMNAAIKLSGEMSHGSHDFFRGWMRACFSRNITDLVNMSDDFQKLPKQDQKTLFQYGINTLRELLMYHSGATSLLRVPEKEMPFIEGFAKAVDIPKLEELTRLLNEAHFHLERNASPKITFLNLSLTIAQFLKS